MAPSPPSPLDRNAWPRLWPALAAALATASCLLGGIAASQPASGDAAAIRRGGLLASVGGCAGCHTPAEGAAFSGGRAIGTPFGAVYSTNITPDPDTGIGRWTLTDFRRAMRDGEGLGGRQLYPAFPYDHFTRATDADITDLYAYLESRTAVRATPPPNRLNFPFGMRPLIGLWKALYFRHAQVAADPGQSADWNRGHYLVESLGHCGGCHTPRNSLGAEQWRRPLSGGWVDGWYAPPLDARSPAARPWTVEALETYLRTGLSTSHGVAAGPMSGVPRELARASGADVHAMAVYLASQVGPGLGQPVDRAAAAAAAHPEGARLFAGACAGCHEAGAPMMNEGRPSLALASPLHEADASDTVRMILGGLPQAPGRRGPAMPAFGAALTDPQIAELAAYLRARYAGEPPWPAADVTRTIAKARAPAG